MKIYTSLFSVDVIKKVVAVALDASKKGGNHLLIVPEKLSLSVEKMLLSTGDTRALTNVQVVTLSRLLKKLGATEANFVSAPAGVMICKKIILENLDSLHCFKKTARTFGFAENIYETISELKNSKVKPADLVVMSATCKQSLALKLKDICFIYGKYEQFLQEGNMIDACDRFELLTNLIYSSSLVRASHCYLVGYESISPSGMEAIIAIAKTAKSFTAGAVENRNKNNSYIASPEMLNMLEAYAGKENLSITEISVKSLAPALAKFIGDNLYAFPQSKKLVSDDTVVLFEANSAIKEVEFVAESIRKSVIKRGIRYRDVAVMCPNLAGYSGLFKMVFADYDIPYFLDAQYPLKEHIFVDFLSLVFTVLRKNYFASDMVSLAKNYFSGIEETESSAFENYTLEYGINFDKFLKPFASKKQNVKDDKVAPLAEQARVNLCAKLLHLSQKLNEAKTVEDFVDLVKLIITEFDVESKMEELATKLLALKSVTDASIAKQVLPKTMARLDEIESLLGGCKLEFEEFVSIFMSGLSSIKISLIPLSVDCVFVGDPSTSKILEVKDLYIIGATEGAVPLSKDDCGLIVDKELEIMSGSLGKKIEPTIRTINERERLKFLMLVCSFTENLCLTYPLLDVNNDEQKPSGAIKELQKLFYKNESKESIDIRTELWLERRRGLGKGEKMEESYAYEYATLKVGQKKLIEEVMTSPTKMVGYNQTALSTLYSALVERLKSGKQKQLRELIMPKQKPAFTLGEKLFFPNGTTSISALESYFSCPYKFFARYGLLAKERKDAKLKSVDVGNVLHKVAELYVKNEKKIAKIATEAEKEKYVDGLISFVFETERVKSATNKHMLVSLASEAKRLTKALDFQGALSMFVPVGEELRFGDKTGNAVKLSSGIKIEGKIDRLDECGNDFRVIDYKTGQIELSPSAVYYGKKVQLFVYLLAEANRGKRPIGAFYLPIRNTYVDETEGDFLQSYKMQGYFVNDVEAIVKMDKSLSLDSAKSKVIDVALSTSKESKKTGEVKVNAKNYILSEELFNGALRYIFDLCSLATKEILAGNIEASPLELGSKEECEYCEFRSACPRNLNSVEGVRKALGKIEFAHFVQGEEGSGRKDAEKRN